MNVCWWGLCSGPPALAAPTAQFPCHTHTEHEGCAWTDREGYLHWHFLWERVEKSPQSRKFSTKTLVSAQTTSTLVLGTHICRQNQNLSKPYVIDWSAWFAGLSVVKTKLEVRVLISFLSWGSFSPSSSLLGHLYKALQLTAMPWELITPWLTCLDI